MGVVREPPAPEVVTAAQQQARLFRERVKFGEVAQVKHMLKEGNVDFQEPGNTVRKWTPLHIACWGTAKPQYDRDIVEAGYTMHL